MDFTIRPNLVRGVAAFATTLLVTACSGSGSEPDAPAAAATTLGSLAITRPIEFPTVAVGPGGQAAALWIDGYGRARHVGWSRTTPGESPAPARALSQRTPKVRKPGVTELTRHNVAVDAHGAVSAAWVQGTTIRFRRVGSGHDLALVLDSRAMSRNAPSPVVAVSNRGDTYVVWAAQPEAGKTVARMRVVHPDGTMSPTLTLSREYTTNNASRWGFTRIVFDSRGRALAGWVYTFTRRGHSRAWVMARRVDRSGRARRLLEIAARGGVASPDLSSAPGGTALISWLDGHRVSARSIGSSGRLGPVHTVVATRPRLFEVVSLQGGGSAIAWTTTSGTLRFSTLRADGTGTETVTVEKSVYDAFQLSQDPSGGAVIVWARWRAEPESTTLRAIRLAADGAPGPIVDVDELPGYPTVQLAMVAGDNGVITALWGAGNDDTQKVSWRFAQYDVP